MDRRCVAVLVCAVMMASATLGAVNAPTKPYRVALADSDAEIDSALPSQPDTHQQLSELSQRIDNLVKVSQQQQKIAQYQLVALAAICVLLVVLLASGLMRRRGI